jgi:putative peptidoglycan lipid II flippase
MQMSVGRASLFMIATLIASRILGWLRLSIIGAKFGQTPELDGYFAAFRIPDTLFNLLVAGALASAFIPVFTSYLAKEREDEAWRVASSVMNAIVILLVLVSGVLWLLAPIIQPILAPLPPNWASQTRSSTALSKMQTNRPCTAALVSSSSPLSTKALALTP